MSKVLEMTPENLREKRKGILLLITAIIFFPAISQFKKRINRKESMNNWL
jgi:hypothetical protein